MIRTRALTKDFVVSRTRTVHAVRGISLDVEPGELVAVLGPNGAGKTTTLRMLTTLIPPTSGTAEVAGYDVVTHPDRVRAAIGYVGQGGAGGASQLVRDELVTQGEIYGLDRRTARSRAAELIEALDLTEQADRKVESLSGGQKRRLDVAVGLVHEPSLLFLDEPSTGLDPHNRANLWEHILRMRTAAAEPMTIVLTTHYLDEADTFAERVIVVDHGQVIADDTADALKAELAGDLVTLRVAPEHAATLAGIAERASGTRSVHVLPGAGSAGAGSTDVGSAGGASTVEIRTADGPGATPGLLRAADDAGVAVSRVDVTRPTLDDVFLGLTGRSLRETAVVDATEGGSAKDSSAKDSSTHDSSITKEVLA
ncbi:ATP-binding cassette domain-containing protein [Promicromonospora iranensis]|uniref:ABC-2 type transport system ATP-binding protein n=1 Tax=Promicromonospora iranensis TaxID=1105144 RepID=A0ABU2CHH5_9MICO|nr:ATP-binding cassette domain-containing protein [Promicromonospora iranensis]MDR7380787.1 ABC-2 type transport system ATP-binding protein [Promicromonospora iranensis]